MLTVPEVLPSTCATVEWQGHQFICRCVTGARVHFTPMVIASTRHSQTLKELVGKPLVHRASISHGAFDVGDVCGSEGEEDITIRRVVINPPVLLEVTAECTSGKDIAAALQGLFVQKGCVVKVNGAACEITSFRFSGAGGPSIGLIGAQTRIICRSNTASMLPKEAIEVLLAAKRLQLNALLVGEKVCLPDVLDHCRGAFKSVFVFDGSKSPSSGIDCTIVDLQAVDLAGANEWLLSGSGSLIVGISSTARKGMSSSFPLQWEQEQAAAVQSSDLDSRDDPWEGIGGMSTVKSRLHDLLISSTREAERYRSFGVPAPRGILLYGPPGCGKTTLVRKLCERSSMAFFYLDCASLLSSFVGESERRVRDVFAEARQQKPSIIFFDEVEAIAPRRDRTKDDTMIRLLTTLLIEIDGFEDSSGCCFVGATNLIDHVDPALQRPGRFDEVIEVPLPPAEDRRAILAMKLKPVPSVTAQEIEQLTTASEGCSSAELVSCCNEGLLEYGEELTAPALLKLLGK